jgi:putative molybdopterin biosynthesis protein
MNKPGTEELMQVREVARYLGINEKKVYFLAKAGKIPCTRVTGKWTFPKTLIDRWVEESASGIAAQPRKITDRSFILAAGSDDPSLGILSDLFLADSAGVVFYGHGRQQRRIGGHT